MFDWLNMTAQSAIIQTQNKAVITMTANDMLFIYLFIFYYLFIYLYISDKNNTCTSCESSTSEKYFLKI